MKSKPIDTPARLAAWANEQFDAVSQGGADHAAILRQAALYALRLGAGDLVGPVADDTAQTLTLATLGRLMAWCRSQADDELLWDSEKAARIAGAVASVAVVAHKERQGS